MNYLIDNKEPLVTNDSNEENIHSNYMNSIDIGHLNKKKIKILHILKNLNQTIIIHNTQKSITPR